MAAVVVTVVVVVTAAACNSTYIQYSRMLAKNSAVSRDLVKCLLIIHTCRKIRALTASKT
jgi:hypothetical protein